MHFAIVIKYIISTCATLCTAIFVPKIVRKLKHSLIALPVAFIFLNASNPIHAQSGRKKKDQQKGDGIITANLQRYIGLLASDSLEGRRAGTAGEDKTINYLKTAYAQLSIPPGDEDKNYIQVFEIDEGKLPSSSTYLKINEEALQKNEDYFPLPWSKEGTVKGASSVALQETGSPWWYDMKDALESNANDPHFIAEDHLKDIAKDAAAKGATALMVFNSAKKSDSISFNGKDRSTVSAIPVIYFTKKAIRKLGISSVSSPYIETAVAFTSKKRTAHNVIASIDNGAPQTIIIGAHFDHLGYGEDDNSFYKGDSAIHNGADDNASGTAATLELARLIKEKSAVPSTKKKHNNFRSNNYLFINFSGEELGLYGSKYFTEHPTVDLSKVNYMINIDMIGRLSDSSKLLTIGGAGTSPLWSDILQTATVTDFNFKIDSSGAGPSDHTSFYSKGIPVLFFFTGLHADYHRPTDDVSKINYAGETRIINYILQVIENSDGKGKLAFTKTREHSTGGERLKVTIGIMPDYTFSGQGVRADAVIDGRPAQKAGLQAGDVITQLGSHSVTDLESYIRAINTFEKGQSTTVTVKRGNEQKELQVTF